MCLELSHNFGSLWDQSRCELGAAPAPQPSAKDAGKEEPYKHQDSFDFIAASMRKCLTQLGPWSIGDLAFGMKALSELHSELADNIEGEPISDRQLLEELLEEARIADAIYERSIDGVAEMCALRPENVVRFLADADRMRPAYCIALRPETRQVLLIVRGTKSIGDAITVLTGSGVDFQGGHTHAGMLHAAQWLLHNETQTLAGLLQEHSGFSLRFIGHSLGAGTAALYAMLLKEQADKGHSPLPDGCLPTCLAIATPACTTRDLATGCGAYVTSVVCQHDLVPRACLWAFEQLREEIVKTKWQDDLTEKFISEGVRDFASTTSQLVAEQYKSVAALLKDKGEQRRAKAVGVLAEAWESLSGNTSKHSDAARQLLSKTALRISQLPATDGGKIAAVANLNSRLRDLKDRLGGSDKVLELREKLERLYSPGSEGGPPAESASVLPAGSEGGPSAESASGPSAGSEGGPPAQSATGPPAGSIDRPEEPAGKLAASEPGNTRSEDPIALAADGDVDEELGRLLANMSEAEPTEMADVAPAPQMFAPGKLIFLKRTSGDGESAEYEAVLGHEGQSFGRIILSKKMITDHLCTTYIAALRNAMEKL